MYFFDKEDFNCNIIPTDWSTYSSALNVTITAYAKNFNNWYETNKNADNSTECQTRIDTLFSTWQTTLVSDTLAKAVLLVYELTSISPSNTCSFNSRKYYDYLVAYNKMVEVSDEITLLTTTGCKLVNFNRNVGVDVSNITGDKKINQCNGVYVRQIDRGSEFIGNINVITNTLEN